MDNQQATGDNPPKFTSAARIVVHTENEALRERLLKVIEFTLCNKVSGMANGSGEPLTVTSCPPRGRITLEMEGAHITLSTGAGEGSDFLMPREKYALALLNLYHTHKVGHTPVEKLAFWKSWRPGLNVTANTLHVTPENEYQFHELDWLTWCYPGDFKYA